MATNQNNNRETVQDKDADVSHATDDGKQLVATDLASELTAVQPDPAENVAVADVPPAVPREHEKGGKIDLADIPAVKENTVPVVMPELDWKVFDGTTSAEDDSDDESGSHNTEPYVPAAVGKLRALARVVMINLRWAKDIRRQDDFKGFEAKQRDRETGHRRSSFFKVGDFMATKRILSGLTDTEKEALRLHPYGRKPEDIQVITKIMERYKCFDKFSPEVRHDLAIWMRYDSFDDARVLLRQGHEPYSMYFILSGSVNFKASDTDPRTGRTNLYPLGVRGPNSIIGEIELLNKDERRSTGITQGDVELLRVDEDPFDDILRNSFENIWEDRFAGLRSAQTFESWTDEELSILNENSSVIAFPENKVILSDVCGQSAFTYFIQKGRCAMVKDVIMEKSTFGQYNDIPAYRALDADDDRRWLSHDVLKLYRNLEGHHLHVTEFKEGDYFGVGEDLRRTHIITMSMVECLTIPRSVFEKANRIHFLDGLKADLEDAIPSDEQIVKEWLARESWKKYKRSHLQEFWQKRHAAEDNDKYFNLHKKWR